MILNAIYDNGRLLIPKEYSFAHNRFVVKVEVPEVEVIWNINPTKTQNNIMKPESRSLQEELRSIYKDALAATDAGDDDLSEKQNTRWASSVMYSSIRDQGAVK